MTERTSFENNWALAGDGYYDFDFNIAAVVAAFLHLTLNAKARWGLRLLNAKQGCLRLLLNMHDFLYLSEFVLRIKSQAQTAILVCSNLAVQISKLSINLTWQECKLETSYRKRVSHHASNLSQACRVKLIANYSKNGVQRQPRIRTPDTSLPKPGALTTQPSRL
ncbi:hypothetical protein AVEN_224064-1 [Araneus ventricosus]|uniref:Uncharacterized protein n=1 Tax=Araneus ventricosus TaxID=182803 RepID=A0A4Y2QGR7_ARAVE|nr:hypothetical protein AVEN_224064-1 [Araneus ventricosus]